MTRTNATEKKYRIVNGLMGWIVSCDGKVLYTAQTRARGKDAVAQFKATDAKRAR